MPRTVGVGHQDFEQMITKNNFYAVISVRNTGIWTKEIV